MPNNFFKSDQFSSQKIHLHHSAIHFQLQINSLAHDLSPNNSIVDQAWDQELREHSSGSRKSRTSSSRSFLHSFDSKRMKKTSWSSPNRIEPPQQISTGSRTSTIPGLTPSTATNGRIKSPKKYIYAKNVDLSLAAIVIGFIAIAIFTGYVILMIKYVNLEFVRGKTINSY